MKALPFAGLQVGIVPDPFNDGAGGFEFASGMDIFSEPGVLKAAPAMAEVSYGSSAQPAAYPTLMVDTTDNTTVRAYIAAGTKLLESTDGTTFNLFHTSSEGAILGLGVFNQFIWYPTDHWLGRVSVGSAGSANDDFAAIQSDNEYHPVVAQGGTLKVGAGRYIASVDESSNVTAQAMKLPSDYRIMTLANHFTNLYMGVRYGALTGGVTTADSSVFAWRGTVLSAGSALPDTPYEMHMRGMNALITDGRSLYAFPDSAGDILVFDGAGFVPFYKITPIKTQSYLTVSHGSVTQHLDTILFGGSSTLPGVFQMKGGAVCQAFVPASVTPGTTGNVFITMVKSTFNGTVYVGYYNADTATFHIERSTANKQNNAMLRTVWHRARVGRNKPTDQLKRWGGIKLNLKPLASGCSVKVEYRTDSNAAFTDPGLSVTTANQDKPVIFPVQPRSRIIQFRFTFTTNGANTPELLSYDLLFEVLNAIRS